MTRKRYTPTFEAQVVREFLKGEKTLAQVADEYGVRLNSSSGAQPRSKGCLASF
jgi:transposase-like protein